MNGIEYLNLRTYRDLIRIRRDLKKQSEDQPLDQALAVYRMCRPEIVSFIAQHRTPKNRMTQVYIDMELARLLMKQPSPETAAEAHPILVETVQFLHRFLEQVDDPNIWQMQAECFHMLVECSLQLDYETQAESYCSLFHRACRGIAKFYTVPLYRSDHLELLEQLYQDTDRVFSASEEPQKQIRAAHARLQLQRCKLWQAEVARLEGNRRLVELYLDMGQACSRGETPRTWALALEYYGKALPLIQADPKYYRMRRALAEVYQGMAEVWMLYEDEASLLKAKACYVRSLDAAKSYQYDCFCREDDPEPARDLLRDSYYGLAAVCGKLPGEKNVLKKEKYLKIAMNMQ